MLQANSFGAINFGHAKLGDRRRTKRLVELVDQIVARPGGTLPQKFRNPADLRAFYRLMNCDQVTHEAILAAHRQATISKISQTPERVLIIHDSTELDFTEHKSLEELGPIGCGTRRGYITQNSLAVRATNGEPVGLVHQILHRRENVSKDESRSERYRRENRESLLWVKSCQALPNQPNCVDVCDRGADNFEFIQYEVSNDRKFVIRSAQNRRMFVGHDHAEEAPVEKLRDYMESLEAATTAELELTSKSELKRGRGKQPKKQVTRLERKAKLAVSYAPVEILASRTAGSKFTGSVKVWCVRIWELETPKGQEKLEWLLLTNEPVDTVEKALEIKGWYELRWVIEEYHKGIKTGVRVESPQFTTEERLQPCIALLSITALTLLQIRDASRQPDAKTRLATEVVSSALVEALSLWRHKRVCPDWTVHDFYLALARLGGHQNRRSDHPPGWQVLWEGWKELLPMWIGYQAALAKQTCGKT